MPLGAIFTTFACLGRGAASRSGSRSTRRAVPDKPATALRFEHTSLQAVANAQCWFYFVRTQAGNSDWGKVAHCSRQTRRVIAVHSFAPNAVLSESDRSQSPGRTCTLSQCLRPLARADETSSTRLLALSRICFFRDSLSRG